MRNMSFSLTEKQFLNESKDVTRRLGWKFLKRGDVLMGVRKAMGLKPGEKIVRLGTLYIVETRLEPLRDITAADVYREGFPGMTPDEFVAMFCSHMKATPETIVNRIQFMRPEEGFLDEVTREAAP